MTALTDKIRTAIEARLQVARAAEGDFVDWNDVALNCREVGEATQRESEHIAANSPDVVARSCEADLELLSYFGPRDTGIVIQNLATRYGVSDD